MCYARRSSLGTDMRSQVHRRTSGRVITYGLPQGVDSIGAAKTVAVLPRGRIEAGVLGHAAGDDCHLCKAMPSLHSAFACCLRLCTLSHAHTFLLLPKAAGVPGMKTQTAWLLELQPRSLKHKL